MKVNKFIFFLFILFFSSIVNLHANNPKVEEISKNLRCLICQGQSVYDSNSELVDGRIINSGDKNLALELEEKGYDKIIEEAAG